MITAMRVTEIEAKKEKMDQSMGFDVTFNVENVDINKDEVKLKFVYTASYKGNAGIIRIRGEMIATEDKDTVKGIEAELKNNRLPAEYMQKVVNAVNYFGTTNATVIATVIQLVPPINMPTLQFKMTQAAPAAGAAPKEAPKKK